MKMNRKILLAIMLVACVASTALGAKRFGSYQSYWNSRFGYEVEYPAAFEPQPEAANGDGRYYLYGNEVEMASYGANNVLDETLEEFVAQLNGEAGKVTLKTFVKPNVLVTSGYLENGKIFYRKVCLTDFGTFLVLTIEYPESQRRAMDEVIGHTFKLFPGRSLSTPTGLAEEY